ncbi:hypothetical protein [Dendrosporobacter sp. 1207_IL3150]|uniref:hypothetical protein n=1 Tax=Dendrosporobacter sp. 1207_IL3150 TaxID=3084054 RepID=UPI002FD8C79A
MTLQCKRHGIRRRYKKFLAAIAGAAVMSISIVPGITMTKAAAAENNPNAITSPANSNNHNEESAKNFNRKNSKSVRYIAHPKHGDDGLSLFRNKNNNSPMNSAYSQIGQLTSNTTVNQQVIYQTNNFKDWTWLENSYPKDMVLGVFLEDVRLDQFTNNPTNNPLNPLNGVDFDEQFVIYAYLGSIEGRGYGIGIEKIAQAGNSITVTVRTNSPQPNEANLPTTKIADFVPVSRKTLNFNSPIQITFIDQKGAVLSSDTF